MRILRDVIAELAGMFLGDLPLTAAILVVIGAATVLIRVSGLNGLVGGAVLVLGSATVLITSVFVAARRHRTAASDRDAGGRE